MIHGLEGRANQDAEYGRRARIFRDFCYVVTTPQRYGNLSWFDILRDPKGWLYLAVAKLAVLAGVPFFLILSLCYMPAAWRFGTRAWCYLPIIWQEGSNHVFVLYTAAGYWHRAEYVHGRGEINQVLCDGNGPIEDTIGAHNLKKSLGVDWGEESTNDNPRHLIRMVKTYRRRPKWYLGLMYYPRTSVGYACHMLGIRRAMIRSPDDLLIYLDSDAKGEERSGVHVEKTV